MERNRQVRLLGLGLLHGLLDLESVQEVVGDRDPIAALRQKGKLDEEGATALIRILEEDTLQPREGRRAPSAPSTEEGEPRTTFPGLPGGNLWDSLPSAGSQTDGSGRHVLQVLTLPAWKHYLNLRFLAEGGMGRVFKAYDPSLKRSVALKFLRRDEPELVARFTLEAQHQARVEHPNICRVYEVGEWQGQSYIAMQFIQGETLEAAIPTLTLEDRVHIMETVAEAIHAAHRVGLIHRDLKPANIMVSRHDQGFEPSILDFGLARGVETTGLTQHGLAVGTIHYMAPEQARGDAAHINRRTDVYGLGATLHKVLTGEPPFAAYDGLEALRRAVEADTPTLRRILPDLPRDLDTITRKCLEKDPARRYESALALAEDLRRWREGEPILARKPSLPYLAVKWAERHKLVVGVAGAALLAIVVLGGVALATASSARARARHAQHFGQEAERIEALVRYSHLLPPHDVRPELEQARARMAALEAEARVAGRLAAGPASYALGRSHLAMGDTDRAKTLLEAAWSGGLHTPEVALALGRALAASYQRGLDLARALPSKELREARERELIKALRDPALARLREGASAALESGAYHEALVAFMGGRWNHAQSLAREALGTTPWLFEAKRLEGEALLAHARALQDPEAALALLSQAEEAFRGAHRLGPSDPDTTLDLVRTLAERAVLEASTGHQAGPTLAKCREEVARMRILRPDGGEAQAHLARALSQWAGLRSTEEPDTIAAFQDALDLSREALNQEPGSSSVLAVRIPVLLAYNQSITRSRRLDPLGGYQEALDLARKGSLLNPQEPVFEALVALCCLRKMTWEINTGTPPWASFEEGLTRARGLRDRFPDLPDAYHGLANLWVERAEFERLHGLDPRPSVAAALEALTAAERRGLRLSNPGWVKGDAYLIEGQYLLATQGEGEAEFRMAVGSYQRARRENPNLVSTHSAVAEALLGIAQRRLDRHLEAREILDEVRLSLVKLGNRRFDSAQTDYLQGLFELLLGREHLEHGADPGPSWARAEAAFRKAATFGDLAKAHVGWAEVRARMFFRSGRAQDRLQALAAARGALRQDPLRAEAWLWIAAVQQETARRGGAGALAEAREAWSTALSLDANLTRWARILGMT